MSTHKKPKCLFQKQYQEIENSFNFCHVSVNASKIVYVSLSVSEKCFSDIIIVCKYDCGKGGRGNMKNSNALFL